MQVSYKEYSELASFFPLNLIQITRIWIIKDRLITDYYPDYFVKKKEYEKKYFIDTNKTMEETKTKTEETISNIKSGFKNITTTVKNLQEYKYFWIIAIAFFVILLLKKR